jgi:hypothetical protein
VTCPETADENSNSEIQANKCFVMGFGGRDAENASLNYSTFNPWPQTPQGGGTA